MNGVCLTGNRPQKIPFSENSRECAELKDRMRRTVTTLIEEGYTRFITGMALGSDIWFAECVLDLKDVYPDLELATKQGIHTDALSKIMDDNIAALNKDLPAYSQIRKVKLYNEEFEKTPKRSIKRYLYQHAK